jgi:hypothetical protein
MSRHENPNGAEGISFSDARGTPAKRRIDASLKADKPKRYQQTDPYRRRIDASPVGIFMQALNGCEINGLGSFRRFLPYDSSSTALGNRMLFSRWMC